MRAGKGLEPENFRGEGGPRTSKKKKQLLLNFSENEFEVKLFFSTVCGQVSRYKCQIFVPVVIYLFFFVSSFLLFYDV